MTNQSILQIFKDCGAIMQGHFLLTSGRHSDTYMQCAKLFEDPKVGELLCSQLLKQIKHLNVNMVASPAMGGIIMGYEIAKQLGIKNIFCERVDNVMTLKRGFEVAKDTNILVVEDVVTTGGSIKEVITLLKNLGANVVGCCSIVDRSNGGVEFEVPYFALLSTKVESFLQQDCPMCKTGESQAYKMGSRK